MPFSLTLLLVAKQQSLVCHLPKATAAGEVTSDPWAHREECWPGRQWQLATAVVTCQLMGTRMGLEWFFSFVVNQHICKVICGRSAAPPSPV